MTTDPHDRPYTFGWHGEVIRRPCESRFVDDADWERGIAEAAWNEGFVAGIDVTPPIDDEYLPRNPYERDEDDQ